MSDFDMSSSQRTNKSQISQNSQTKKLNATLGVDVAIPQTTPLDRGMPRPWRIGLLIIAMQVELVFDLTEDLIIGRSHSDTELFKGIDLSPFNGYEMGVSRRHAIIRLENEKVVLVDNNSANGTLINEERIEPGKPYPVRNGDLLRLGMMNVKIEFLTNPMELA